MTDQEALLEIRRALGCPEWSNPEHLVELAQDIVRAVERIFALNCMLMGPATEQFVLCPTLTRLQEMEAHFESEISKEQEEAR